MIKKMKKTIAVLAVSGALAISGITGAAVSASANSTDPIPNTVNKEFSHDNSVKGTSLSEWRVKNNTTMVYVFPTKGRVIYTKVMGKKYKGDEASERSKVVKIPIGTEGSITNWAKESGDRFVCLRMARTAVSSTVTSGWWSPDSTKNYTIFPEE